MRINNLENANRRYTASLGNFHILEHLTDASVSPSAAADAYFMGKMGVRRRQVVIELDGTETAVVQAGAMQWSVGNVNATTGVKADNTFLVYQDTYIMGDPGHYMGSTEVEVPEKYFTTT